MSEFDDMLTDTRRKIRLDRWSSPASDSPQYVQLELPLGLPDPATPLPPVTIKASAFYDDKTGRKNSVDIELTTARHLDADLIRTVVSCLDSTPTE